MPTITETLRQRVEEAGAYKTAQATGLQYRTLREFLGPDVVPNGRAIDTLAEYFQLELKPKTKPKLKPKTGRRAGPKPRK